MPELSESAVSEAMMYRLRGWSWREIGDALNRGPTDCRKAVEAFERAEARKDRDRQRHAKSRAEGRGSGKERRKGSQLKLEEIQRGKALRIAGKAWDEIGAEIGRSGNGIRRPVLAFCGGEDPIGDRRLALLQSKATKDRLATLASTLPSSKATPDPAPAPKLRHEGKHKGDPYKPELIAEGIRLRKTGLAWDPLCESLGASVGLARAIRKQCGGDPLSNEAPKKRGTRSPHYYDDSQLEEGTKLRRMGKTWKQIGEIVGGSHSNLARHIKKFAGGDPLEMALALGEIDLSSIPRMSRPRRGPGRGKAPARKAPARKASTRKSAAKPAAPKPRPNAAQPGEVVVHLYGKELLSLSCTGEDALAVIALLER